MNNRMAHNVALKRSSTLCFNKGHIVPYKAKEDIDNKGTIAVENKTSLITSWSIGANRKRNRTLSEEERRNTLDVLWRGKLDSVDLKDIKTQVQVISYNTKREIERSSFEINQKIGSGNFGSVYKEEMNGLYGKNTKTLVAIKSLHTTTDLTQVDIFIDEIKIMSNLDPHLNLVNMIGSCTCEYIARGELWLLLEFCTHGDLKKFLIENQPSLLLDSGESPLNTRCLLLWIYGIAQGMQYLAKHKIMHGDLAARNILLSEDPFQSKFLLPKIADFGLSKKFHDNVRYNKELRPYVPWKWMAIEFLTKDFFTLKSDVWSFAVVVWEILTFGREPYVNEKIETVIRKLEEGQRLPCPHECKSIRNWSSEKLYNELSIACFDSDIMNRVSFTEVTMIIEKELSPTEIENHRQMNAFHQFIRDSNYLEIRRHGAVQSK